MLKDKIAIVTGAASGIGKSAAATVAGYGAHVALMDKSEEGLLTAEKEVALAGGSTMRYAMDVSRSKDCQAAVDAVVERFGRVDILINCAGIIRANRIEDMPEEEWDLVMDVNLKGTFLMGKIVGKLMMQQKYGRILNAASQAGKLGEAGNAAYCASKAGVVLLTQVQGLELAAHGVTANAISPGYIDTPMMQDVFLERGPLMGMTPKEYEALLLRDVPMGRMARPEEVSELIAFLVSDKASYMTGVTYTVAGGKLLF